jgi:hypothetical protein
MEEATANMRQPIIKVRKRENQIKYFKVNRSVQGCLTQSIPVQQWAG